MSNRRDFFRQTLAGAAAVAIPGVLSNEALATDLVNRNTAYGKPLPLSVLAYSFNVLVSQEMMDIFGYMETCRYRYGLDAADMWVGMFKSTEDAYIDKVHRGLKERQLVIPNIACDGAHLIPVASARTPDSPEERARLRSVQDTWLNICKKLGVGFLRCDAGPNTVPDPKEPWKEADFDYLVRRYREMAQFAYDNGFTVGAENHMGTEKYWPNMEKLIRAIDHPGFGICIHFGGWTANSPETALQDNIAADKAAARWVRHTHIPWETCMDAAMLTERMNILHDAGYPGYYSIEHHSGQNEYALVGVQLDLVKGVINSWNTGGTGQLIPPRQPRN